MTENRDLEVDMLVAYFLKNVTDQRILALIALDDGHAHRAGDGTVWVDGEHRPVVWTQDDYDTLSDLTEDGLIRIDDYRTTPLGHAVAAQLRVHVANGYAAGGEQ